MGSVWNVFAKRLDKIGYGFIDFVVTIMNLIRPGWAIRNRARIEEWKLMIYAFNRSFLGVLGLFLIMIYLFLGIFGPIVAPYKYNEYPISQVPELWLVPPGKYGMLLGTDTYGRDVLSLLLYGARFSLALTLLVILISAPLGIFLGLISGYFGGKIDELIQRITDIFYSFPMLVLALALAAILPDRIRSLLNANPWLAKLLLALFAGDPKDIGTLAPFISIIIAISIVGWPGYTRLVRGMVLSVRENVYVEAAKALGVGDWQILRKHILPNIMSIVVVLITFDLSSIVILGAALSFLGLGAQDPFTDWGKLVYNGSRYFPDVWWLIVFPGLTLFLVGLGWTFFGDTLRDVLDPTTRRRLEYGTEEKVTAGDIMAVVGEIILMIAIVYAGLAVWDIMMSVYMIVIVAVAVILYRVINGAFGYEGAVHPLSLAALALPVFSILTLGFMSGVLTTIALALYFISPYFKKMESE